MEENSETAEQATAPTISFIKKRPNRSNQRKRTDDDEDNTKTTSVDNTKDDGIDREKLKDLKLIHQFKQRASGLSVEELLHGDKKATHNNKQTDDLKSILGNQFNSRMDYGIQQNIPHEKLMEEYINQKLGLNQQQKETASHPDDELYRLPEELKFDTNQIKAAKVKVSDEDTGAASSWSTGIAEVALPIDYKLKNIEATEKAAQHILQQDYWSQITSKSTPAYKRFEVDQSVTASMLPYGANMDHAIPSAGISDLNQHNKRPLKSTDDLALDRFKKRVIYRK